MTLFSRNQHAKNFVEYHCHYHFHFGNTKICQIQFCESTNILEILKRQAKNDAHYMCVLLCILELEFMANQTFTICFVLVLLMLAIRIRVNWHIHWVHGVYSEKCVFNVWSEKEEIRRPKFHVEVYYKP